MSYICVVYTSLVFYFTFFSFIKERSKINTLSMKNKKASSFHEFARDTSDAWDIGDDEDEDFSSFQTLNSKVAKATAAQVLENHSRKSQRMKPEWPQAALSDTPINCKVIKSNSEAQLSRGPGTLPLALGFFCSVLLYPIKFVRVNSAVLYKCCICRQMQNGIFSKPVLAKKCIFFSSGRRNSLLCVLFLTFYFVPYLAGTEYIDADI